jgi:hypothetical protein
MQSEAASLPVAGRYVPATQSMQSEAASLPMEARYVPAAQSMHAVMPITF